MKLVTLLEKLVSPKAFQAKVHGFFRFSHFCSSDHNSLFSITNFNGGTTAFNAGPK
jgi:hypothetical protein